MQANPVLAALDAEGEANQQAHARARQVLLMTVILDKLDIVLQDAAKARIPAPGLIELRQWAVFNLEENAEHARQAAGVAG